MSFNDVGLSTQANIGYCFPDPQEGLDEIIEVPIMQNSGELLKSTQGSPHQRKPDLVLYGDGKKKEPGWS